MGPASSELGDLRSGRAAKYVAEPIIADPAAIPSLATALERMAHVGRSLFRTGVAFGTLD